MQRGRKESTDTPLKSTMYIYPAGTKRCFNVVLRLILGRDVEQPNFNVNTTLLISMREKPIFNVETTLDFNVETTLDFNVETSDFNVETTLDFNV